MNELDHLAQHVRMYGLVLAYSQRGYAKLAFRYPALPSWLRLALRNRRRGLAQLMLQGDVRLCPAPDLHRREWRYAGQGRYQCEVCRRIDAQLGMWEQLTG